MVGCDSCGRGAPTMTVRVGYLRAPVAAGGYYFPRTSRRGPQRTRRSGFALAPNYRFLGDDGYTPPPTAQSYLPAGSLLGYNGKLTKVPVIGQGARDVASAVQGILGSKWGISIDNVYDNSGVFSSGQDFTFVVHTTRDYGQATDVKSIIDGEIYNAWGQMPVSTIAVTNAAAGAGASALAQKQPTPPFDLGTWMSNNWPWFAVGGVGLIAAKELL